MKVELDVPQEKTIDAMCEATQAEGAETRIVVLHRGWIVVGHYSCDGDGYGYDNGNGYDYSYGDGYGDGYGYGYGDGYGDGYS